MPSAALSVTGSLKTYVDTGDSGKPVRRQFCPDCGSPILSRADGAPGLAVVKAGTLDDRSWLEPTMDIWCGSAQPWVALSGNREKFDKGRS